MGIKHLLVIAMLIGLGCAKEQTTYTLPQPTQAPVNFQADSVNGIIVVHDLKRRVTCWVMPQGYGMGTAISCLPDDRLSEKSWP